MILIYPVISMKKNITHMGSKNNLLGLNPSKKKVLDFSNEYKASVFSRMIDGFSNGHVPNPDIFCNQYVKFKVFFDTVRRLGFDYLATGHYANIDNGRLIKANDAKNDQKYFLCAIDQNTLSHLKFPLGQLTKN